MIGFPPRQLADRGGCARLRGWIALAGFSLGGCASPPVFPRMGTSLPRAEARLAGLELTCEPAEAEVLLDGVPQGACAEYLGKLLPLGEGSHRIEIQKPGFWPQQLYVEPGGTRMAVEVRLVPR